MKKLILAIGLLLMLIPAAAQKQHTDYTLPDTPKRAKYIDYPSLDKGLWFAVQLTPSYFFREGVAAGADLVAGYRFGEFIKLGAGISPAMLNKSFLMPIYLDVRGNIISQESRMVVPYWNVDLGYTVGSVYNGFYASPTAGIRVGMPRNDFIAGLTYIAQFVPGTVLHGVGIRLGFEF